MIGWPVVAGDGVVRRGGRAVVGGGRGHRWLPSALLALLLFLLLVRPVAGHAYLQRADPLPDAVLPSAPPTVQVWFTETIEPSFSELVVLDTALRPVHTTRAEVSADRLSLTLTLPPLSDGAYTVSWKTLSTVDGHPARGFHALVIGQGGLPAGSLQPPVSAAPPPSLAAQTVVRWLTFSGQALLVGGLIAGALVLTPLLQAGSIADAVRRRRRRLDQVAIVMLIIGALDALVLQAAVALEVPLAEALGGPALTVLTTTRFGLLWSGRLLLIVLLAGLLVWLAKWPPQARWPHGLANALGLGLLLTTSLTSHAAASQEWTVVAVLADWLHLVATSAWIGGLALLVVALPAAINASPPHERLPLLGRIVDRFSRLSLIAVAILIVTGGVAAVLHIDRPEALTGTDYGRALGAKLLLLLPMLSMAALNLLRVRPVLRRVVAASGPLATRLATAAGFARRLLTLATRAELILGLLILVATGVLTSLPPARQPTVGGGVTQTETIGDLRLTMRVTPALPGENTLEVTATSDGRPVDGAQVVVRLTLLDRELGETEVVLSPASGGRYTVQTRQLGALGQWQAELIIRRDGRDDARTAVRFAVPAELAPTVSVGPSWPALTRNGWIGLASLLGGMLLVASGLRLRRRPTFSGSLLGTGLGAFVLAGYLLISGGLAWPSPATAAGRNPYPPTAQSLARGRVLYSTNCQTCHGITGRGDGPTGRTLQTQPADFTQHVGLHSDAELYRQISQGFARTGMPPFAGVLSEEERWHLVNYIKTFEGAR